MLATSTKSEVSYAESIGTVNMFLPDFANSGTAFENYVRGYVEQVLQHVQGKKTLSLDHYPLRISGQTRF